MNLEHIVTAVRTHRIDASDAASEVIDDAVLNREAIGRGIITPGTREEQHSCLVTFFNQLAEQEG